MKKLLIVILILIAVGAALVYGLGNYFTVSQVAPTPTAPAGEPVSFLTLPEGFRADVFWSGEKSALSLPGVNTGPRLMITSGDAVLVSLTKQGMVIALEDTDNDGAADKETVVIDGLSGPHGLATLGDWLYIAEEARVIRVKDADKDL